MIDPSLKNNPALLRRSEAARELRTSLSSLDLMIARQFVKTVHKGRHVFITRDEVLRVMTRPLPSIWPPKQNGKTTRHFAPATGEKKPPIKASLAPHAEAMAVNQ